MMITLELDTVDLMQIAASGQCFRMAPLEDGRWLVPMGRWMAMARQRDARRIELSADGEDASFLDAIIRLTMLCPSAATMLMDMSIGGIASRISIRRMSTSSTRPP